MQIDPDACVGCGQCVPYCPVGAITSDVPARIDYEECVECGNCLRSANCPADAIYQDKLQWPRIVRSILSDVLTIAAESGISGRGTEEMKTNEVTGRFKLGEVGVAIEVGRPVTGARFHEVERIAQAVASLGVTFEKVNPTTSMMSDPKTGKFQDDLLNEKVLSAILEFSIKLERLPDLFQVVETISKEIDSVFSLDIATRIAPDGSNPTAPYLKRKGLWVAPNGKTNVGLGRPPYREDME